MRVEAPEWGATDAGGTLGAQFGTLQRIPGHTELYQYPSVRFAIISKGIAENYLEKRVLT